MKSKRKRPIKKAQTAKRRKRENKSKLSKVKDFFQTNEQDLGEIERNFRNTHGGFHTKNAQFSKTFFNRRKENIES